MTKSVKDLYYVLTQNTKYDLEAMIYTNNQ